MEMQRALQDKVDSILLLTHPPISSILQYEEFRRSREELAAKRINLVKQGQGQMRAVK